MGIDPLPQIIVALVALFLSGFFTLLKYSYQDLNKFKIQEFMEEDLITSKKEGQLLILLDNLSDLQTAFLISDYFSNAFAAAAIASIGYYCYQLTGLIVAVIVASILILVIGESAPYYISWAMGNKVCIKFVGFALAYTKFSRPICSFVSVSSKALGSLFGLEKDSKEPKITEDQLFNAMNLSKEQGLLDVNEYGIIEKVFDFSDTYVKDVMTPRTDVVAIDIEDTSMDEIIKTFVEEGYSRIPFYENDIDNVLGILHVKDLLPIINEKDIDIRKYLRKPIYSFEYQKSSYLFAQMRKNNSTMAIVLDEYGGTDGIVTMEDLIEEIVGEIEDEYDDDSIDEEIRVLNKNAYLLDGALRLEDLNERLNLRLESDEVDTIAGFIFEKFDRIPEQGEVLEYENLIFTILDLDKNRISKIKLQVK
ncbi:hemolysin family protein [Neofamilia massiliensis]|uniref:hemolysin family protein n=1 Tax=Neofamilia massiliensis TaxID=1673724 RepID=UPI0006BB6C90|nr:hemolysin family protein [Neofamilia massiliensis]